MERVHMPLPGTVFHFRYAIKNILRKSHTLAHGNKIYYCATFYYKIYSHKHIPIPVAQVARENVLH